MRIAVVTGALLAAAGCRADRGGLGSDGLDDADLADADATFADASVDSPTVDSPASDVVDSRIVLETGGDAGDATADATFVRDGSYPRVKSIKGIVPDGGAIADLAAAGAGRALLVASWPSWEPAVRAPPCSAAEQEFDGHCFVVDPTFDAAVKAYTDAGIVVSVFFGSTPSWANTQRVKGCVAASNPVYCAPDDPVDFARFGAMLATRYGDKVPASADHGRISDFIVGYSVMFQFAFDVGALPVGGDLKTAWLKTYADLFDATFDAITAVGDEVRVYPLVHYYRDDDLIDATKYLGWKSILASLASQSGSRAWRIAAIPVATTPNFSPADAGTALTFGNVGALAGWADANLGTVPSRREFVLLYAGFDAQPSEIVTGTGVTGPAAQSYAMCLAHRQLLATPTAGGWLYYTHLDQTADAPYLDGLRAKDGSAKAAWNKWSTMDTTALDCGFEALPYVVLHGAFNATAKSHWTTTRMTASGFADVATWKLLRAAAPQTHELFECVSTGGSKRYVSFDAACEGQTPLGSVGFTYDATAPGRVELFRCDAADGKDSVVTTNASCDPAYTFVSSLGFAVAP